MLCTDLYANLTPLGVPVEPVVKRISANSSSSGIAYSSFILLILSLDASAEAS